MRDKVLPVDTGMFCDDDAMEPSTCVRLKGGGLVHCRSFGAVFVQSNGTSAIQGTQPDSLRLSKRSTSWHP